MTDLDVTEWAQWRGQITAKVNDLPDQMTLIAAGLNERLTALDTNINRRMDKQDDQIAETLQQAKMTNGRVNAHDVTLAEIVTQRDTTQEVENEEASKRRYRMSTVVAASTAAATFMAALIELAHLFL